MKCAVSWRCKSWISCRIFPGVAFDLDGTLLVDMRRGLPRQGYGAVCAGTAGRGRGARILIGNGADVLDGTRADRAREERATLRKTMGETAR